MTNDAEAAAGSFTLRPIGYVRGGRAEPTDDGWDAVHATIALTPDFGPEALAGLDAIDGTPVLDLKPVMRGFVPRGEVRGPEWVRELMSGYWA